ncbi:cytochrome o ubiquinol oxidase subunit IV [Paenibacillus herberti]|uniref:Cytochrome o ubiquinol oxidase subunit IV n=1 Tax=Paenibacillus herberti TaxID=1619309 RepID=A0A229P2Y5_9BACL|nr:cytochrome o ubiquinol oxidase subunit IV [Paenibacillus herberti]OXM16470.1 cytochrome o ubiquinol oxidase subunit IV [Paenibacillus herberti]
MSQHSADNHSHDHGHGHHEEEAHGSIKSYTMGFILSLILTVIPMVIVFNDLMGRTGTLAVILITAVAQLFVQMWFFMHIRDEKGPRYNLMALSLGILLVITIIAGSVWIMSFNSYTQ